MAKVKDAMQLRPGDRIRTSGGKVETVVRPTGRGAFNTVEIHTSESDIITTAPCPVQVETEGGR